MEVLNSEKPGYNKFSLISYFPQLFYFRFFHTLGSQQDYFQVAKFWQWFYENLPQMQDNTALVWKLP